MTEFGPPGEGAIDARLRQHGEALRAERSGCPHPELLFARHSEALDDELRRRLDAHVSTCVACRRLADDVDSLGLSEPDAAVEQRVLARLGGTTRAGRSGLLSLAAGLLLAAGLGATWWYSRPRAPMAQPPAASQTGVDAPPVSQAPTPVVALWAVTPAPVRVPLSSLGVPRGAGGPAEDGLALVEALGPYQLGDYAGAIARLSDVVRAYPESGEAHFYLGVSQLMAGQAEHAIASFHIAMTRLPAARRAEAEWYRATSEQRAGRTDQARARVRGLCAQPGDFQAQACAAEASLK